MFYLPKRIDTVETGLNGISSVICTASCYLYGILMVKIIFVLPDEYLGAL